MKRQFPEGTTLFHFTKTGSSANHTTQAAYINMIKKWVEDNFGDVADEPRKRILLQLDGGPALHLDPDKLESLRKQGIIIFQGA